MGSRVALSKGEMEVVRILWDIGPATVRQIFDAVIEYREADFTTIQTFMRRIERKGYATSELKGRTRVYSAKARPRTVIRETVDDLVDRLFGGNAMPLVRHIMEDCSVDESDIQELKQLVQQLEQAKEAQASKEAAHDE